MASIDLPDEVEVDSVETEGRVSVFTGSFLLRGRRYRFSGVAVLTIGGPTVGVSLSNESMGELLAAGIGKEEVDAIVADLQRRIVEGDFRMVGEPR